MFVNLEKRFAVLKKNEHLEKIMNLKFVHEFGKNLQIWKFFTSLKKVNEFEVKNCGFGKVFEFRKFISLKEKFVDLKKMKKGHKLAHKGREMKRKIKRPKFPTGSYGC